MGMMILWLLACGDKSEDTAKVENVAIVAEVAKV